MRFHRTDENQKEIVQHLRDWGCKVSVTSANMGGGFPDLVVYNPRKDFLRLIEIKRPGEKLSADQVKFHNEHGSSVFIATSKEEAEEGMQLGRR